MVIELATAGAVVLTVLGELLHARRVRRLARLAFGPRARAAAWVRAAPLLRVLAAGALAWGLSTLLELPPKVHVADSAPKGKPRHLLLVLDVSPSMRLQDAGPTGEQTRTHRARDVLESLFARVSVGQYKVSVVAVYNGAKPVVIDTSDSEVVRNILTDLPMHWAFRPGKTRLFDGLDEAAKIARTWEARSTILVVVSDGDTIPAKGMPEMPPSIGSVLVVGVGDPLAGKFLDGRQSRQDSSTLRQMAHRLGGVFFDGNRKHLPSEMIRSLSEGARSPEVEQLTLREYALLAVAVGAGLLALLPLLLHLAGTFWRPGALPAARSVPRVGRSAAESRRALAPTGSGIR